MTNTQNEALSALNRLTITELKDTMFLNAFQALFIERLVSVIYDQQRSVQTPVTKPTQLRPTVKPVVVKPVVAKPASTFKLSQADRIAQLLPPGTIVKMSGTRDKHGLRVVLAINFSQSSISCARLEKIDPRNFSRYNMDDVLIINDPNDTQLSYYRFLRDHTVHGFDKVVAVVKPYGSKSYRVEYQQFS